MIVFNRIDAAMLEEEKCEPIHKLAFAKTHKTGSSTLQNIIFRYLHNYNHPFSCKYGRKVTQIELLMLNYNLLCPSK